MENLYMPWTYDYDEMINPNRQLFVPKNTNIEELHDSQESEEPQIRKFFRHY